jgi:multidrug efflux pump subunit AcrA (membrane-fusion protein)
VKKLLAVLVVVCGILMASAYWISSPTPGRDVAYERRAIERGLLVETVSATGQLAPRDIYVVTSPVPGQVTKIYANADTNRYVERDEPLLLLDPSQAKVKLEQARAAALAARTDIGRAEGQRDAAKIALDFQKDLLEKKVGQKAKVEEAEYLHKAAEAAIEAAKAKYKMAERARDEAQLGLDKCIVRAPASGVILKREVYLGQMVGPQLPTPLFKMASDLSEVDVMAQIAEGDVSKVQAGQTAIFTVYPYADANIKFEGRVKRVDNLPNTFQGAVFYNTVIQVVNRREPPTKETWMRVSGVFASTPLSPGAGLPWIYLREEDPWMLRPGMTATVDVVRRRHVDVWKLPVEALSLQLDEHYQTAAAKEKVKHWSERSDADDWKHVWIQDPKHGNKPWPIFVRINGMSPNGEPGIRDNQFIEVLEWDPELATKLDPKDQRSFPEVIISAPPATKPGLLDFNKPTRIMS